MKCIVAVDKNFAIGREGKLLLHVPNDMNHFRSLTEGKVVVLGRKTLQTFPQGQPLPNRTNIILSRNKDFKVKGAVVVNSLDELKEEIKKYPSDDVCVIGGEQIYKQLLPLCDTCEVTYFDREFDADAFFPDLDNSPDWKIAEESEEQVYFDTLYTFRRYILNN